MRVAYVTSRLIRMLCRHRVRHCADLALWQRAEAEAKGRIEAERLLACARESLAEGDFAGALTHAEGCRAAATKAGREAGAGLEEARKGVMARAHAGLEREEAGAEGVAVMGEAEMMMREGNLEDAGGTLARAGGLVERGGARGSDVKQLHILQVHNAPSLPSTL